MLKLLCSNLKWIVLIGIGASIDQLSKYLILENLQYAQSLKLFPGLNFTLSYNPGIAFGWFNSGAGWTQVALLVITLGITLGLFVWLLKTPKALSMQAAGLGLVIGGALGNLIDRFFRGYVVDFIDFYIKNWHWHTFNIADALITVGAGLLILCAFVQKDESS